MTTAVAPCYAPRSIPPGTACRSIEILLEMVLTPGNDPHLAKFLDIEMLTMASGRERTEAEFAELFHRAGFKLTRVVQTKSPLWVVEAAKV